MATYWSSGYDRKEMTEEICDYSPLPEYVKDMGAHAGPTVRIVDEFVRSIIHGPPAPIGPKLAVNMTLPGLAAVASIDEEKTVCIPDPAGLVNYRQYFG